MNKLKIINIALVFTVLSLTLMSCQKYLDINVDPNNSPTTTAELQLPAAQLYIGSSIGDRLFQQTSVWSQYYTGGPGVSLGDWDKNKMATSDGNQVFNSLFRSMSNLDFIIRKTNEPYYGAISQVMTAYSMQVLVDLFGNVPYTQALKGDISDGSISSPSYDNAKDVIYPDLERRILAALNTIDTNAAGIKLPGNDDLIYQGDLARWKKFARSLLLKLYIRQGDVAKTKFATVFNAGPTDLILTNADNTKISYPGGAQSRNPFWTSAKSTALGNYFVGSKTTVDYLLATSDPRVDFFFDKPQSGNHLGLKQGDVENAPSTADFTRPKGARATNGGLIFRPTAPVILMSAWEVNLILAEAVSLGWITGNAKAFYDAAIDASALYLGAPDMTTYKAGPGAYDATSAASRRKSIALQKWVSMNGLQPIEAWIETRRFDNTANPIFASPGGLFVTPTRNSLPGDSHPSILFYPATEQDLNSNFPGQHDILLNGKVFWDN